MPRRPETESEAASAETATEQSEPQEPDGSQDRGCLTSLRLSLSPSQSPDRDSVTIREEIFYALSESRLPILSMQMEKTSLEQVFLELTQSGQQPPEQEEKSGHGTAGSGIPEPSPASVSKTSSPEQEDSNDSDL